MRKTNGFLLVFVLSTTCLLAQDSTSARLKIGVNTSSDYCSYLLYINNERQQPGEMFLTEEPSLGWSVGLMASFGLNRNMTVTGGLRYTDHSMSSGPYALYDINRNEVGTLKLTYHTRYIDAPIGIQFNTNQEKRVFFIANAAIAPGVALGEWNEVDFEGEDTLGIRSNTSQSTPADFNFFSVKGELYTGLGVNVGRYQIQCLPQFRYCLFKAVSESFINRRYWSTGLEFRVLYTI